MERILYILLITVPFILTIIFFIRSRNVEGYIEETSIKKVKNKDRFIEELKKFCAKKKWDVQFAEEQILIRTNLTIYSYGEIITIVFLDKDDGLYMKASSKPKIKTTRIDYNKNKNNVELITGLA